MIPALLAHRGRGSPETPELTIASLEMLGHWIDGVEIDVRMSSDGIPVLMHDATVTRTTGAPGPVNSYTVAQLAQLDAGNGPVPTLTQYLDACSGRGYTWIVLDIKEETQACITATAQVVAAASPAVQAAIWWFGSNRSTMEMVRATVPTARIIVSGVNASTIDTQVVTANAVDATVMMMSPNAYAENRHLAETIRGAGFDVGASTSNTAGDLDAAREDQIRVLFTDITDQLANWNDTDPDPDPDPPPDELPSDSPATATSEVKWCAFWTKSGEVIAWLPGITGSISRTICAYTTTTLTMPAPIHGQLALPYDIMGAITRGVGSVGVCCIINDKPAWAGIVTRTKHSHGVNVELAVSSLETYLWWRYVGDAEYTDLDESSIVSRMLHSFVVPQGIRMVLDCPPTGTTRTRRYHHTDDGIVGERLTELAEVQGGPEWLIDIDWETPGTRLLPVFRLRPYIGSPQPVTTLSTTGPAKARWTHMTDYGDGYGATHVIAYSSGEGDDRPESTPHVAAGAEARGIPRRELRFSPASNVTTPGVLEQHADRRLSEVSDGTETFELVVRRDAEPGRWAVDWNLGDAVDVQLVGHAEPGPIVRTVRIIGWSMDTMSGDMTLTVLA